MAQTTQNRLREVDPTQFLTDPTYAFDPPLQAPPGSPQTQQPSQPRRVEAAATSLLLTSLRALSARFVIALGNLFSLLTIGSAWYLWYAALPSPSVLQLVGLGLYGLLILALNFLVLRRR